MTQLLLIRRLLPAVALVWAVSGCGGETSVQTAPEGSEIERYVAENPELLNGDSLDAADEAEMNP